MGGDSDSTNDSGSSDPTPQPPREPGADDCCGGGCTPCVYDLYWEAFERYEAALAAWQARQN